MQALYRGESGVALGFSSICDNGKWIFKGIANADSRSDFSVGTGLGFIFE
ncbi:YadA-like family protein [Moraxella nasovis]|nr:YadA-like family protein [Moraxella nasovis]